MYKGNKFLAIVPARGGSKGIPHKNIVKVHDKPLIEYTLDAAFDSQYLDEIYVSTDDDAIAKVVKECGAKVLMRPSELATDNSKTIDVLMHAIREVGEGFDYLVLLQPTQPMRKAFHIDETIEEMVDNQYSSLVSVSEVENHPVLIRKMGEDKKLTPILNMSSTVRRQDFQKYYVVNGAVYINKISDMTLDTSLNDNEYGYVMDQEYAIDIDEPFDIFIFEQMLKRQEQGRM